MLIKEQLNWLIINWQSSEVSEDIPEDRKWWEFWKIDAAQKTSLNVIGRYLVEAIDDFVQIVIKYDKPFEAKYATVLDGISILYDVVIKDAKMPWWLLPFKSSVKSLLINVVASLLIEHLLRKYSENVS